MALLTVPGEPRPAPLTFAFILGPLMEEYLRRAMLLSRGNPWVFVQRPISATRLGLAALAMCAVLPPALGKARKEAFWKMRGAREHDRGLRRCGRDPARPIVFPGPTVDPGGRSAGLPEVIVRGHRVTSPP